MLNAYDLVITKNTRSFTLSCQKNVGGFGKWPDTYPDVPFPILHPAPTLPLFPLFSFPAPPQSSQVLHSYFSLCGLSFIGEPGLLEVNPVLGFSQRSVERLKAIHGDSFNTHKY